MKKLAFPLFLALLISFSLPVLALQFSELEPAAPGLPQLPMLEAFEDMQNVSFAGGTCKVIRPITNHSDCTYSLCESHGCGAPFSFDEDDCACYCSYAF